MHSGKKRGEGQWAMGESVAIDIEAQKRAFLAAHWNEYFWCERERCLMQKSLCVAYQKQARGTLEYRYLNIAMSQAAADRSGCRNCPQGKKIAGEASGNRREAIGKGR